MGSSHIGTVGPPPCLEEPVPVEMTAPPTLLPRQGGSISEPDTDAVGDSMG